MKKVELKMNELEKYHIIKNLVEKNGNKTRAAIKLNCTIRKINRLVQKFKTEGKIGFQHKNIGRKPSNTMIEATKAAILKLYKTKYEGANFKHFQELLAELENTNVSYNFLYNLMVTNYILSPQCQRITKRNFNKKMKNKQIIEINDNIKNPIDNAILPLNFDHPRKPRAKHFGESAQMGASVHLWFGDKNTFLHLAIDNATGKIIGGYFDDEETLNGYYHVFHQILTNYGIPFQFLTDHRTIFTYKQSNNPSEGKDTFTQFSYACKQLGIELETSSVAQHKGQVERAFGTLQSRLVTLLKINKIIKKEEANLFLETYFTKFNEQFALPQSNFKAVFEKITDKSKINNVLSVIETRKIDNGCSIKYYNKIYQPYENGKIVPFKNKTECLVIKTFDNKLLLTHNEKVYELIKLSKNQKISKNFDHKISAEKNVSKKRKKLFQNLIIHEEIKTEITLKILWINRIFWDIFARYWQFFNLTGRVMCGYLVIMSQ